MYLEYAEATSFISYGSQAHSLEQKFPRISFHIRSSWECQKWLLIVQSREIPGFPSIVSTETIRFWIWKL